MVLFFDYSLIVLTVRRNHSFYFVKGKFLFKSTVLILIVFNSFLSAQNYLWPTNASNALSSSFCEYRPGHYHAAIDIKTWNREGYKCFAVEDGVIERIKISPFGAGKALYIKLNDGRKAVYFHLQRFTKKLEQKISEIQRAKKSYSIEWWPKNWHVKRGEIIAYTGQTGIGVPHLHFELRDEMSRPLNPLKFYKNVKDKIRPNLKQLLIIPQNEKSNINGSFVPQKFKLSYIRDGVYVIKEPIFAHGILGLAINGFDQADGVNNKLGFYSSKMAIEGKQVFEQAYNRLHFKNTRMVDIDIYYPEKARTKKNYNKLYLEPFNDLSFYNRKLGDGLISVNEDTVDFEISIEDFYKNKSIVKGQILPGKINSVKIKQSVLKDENMYLKLTMPSEIKGLKFFSGRKPDSMQEISYFEVIERLVNGDESILFLKIKLADKRDFLIRSEIENKFGQTIKTLAILNSEKEKQVKSHVELFGKQLYLSFKNIADSENLTLNILHSNNSNHVKVNIADNSSEFIFPAKDFIEGPIDFNLQDLNQAYFDTTVTANLLLPDQIQNFSFNDDSLTLSSTIKTVYDTLFFTVEKDTTNREEYDLPIFGSSYKMSIGDQILNRTLTLSLKSDSTFFADGQAAIYSLNKKGLHFVGGKYDARTGNISTRVKTFSTYIIAADTIAPDVKVKNPAPGKSYNNMPEIMFNAVDEVSKIGSDKNIEIYFDKDYVVPEWDFETNNVRARLHYKPQKGNHKITIKVKDRAGNLTEKIISFFIN